MFSDCIMFLLKHTWNCAVSNKVPVKYIVQYTYYCIKPCNGQPCMLGDLPFQSSFSGYVACKTCLFLCTVI